MSFTRHFPDEVLLLIIHHTIPLEARYHNLPDHLSTLHSLSLTSKAVRSLTRNVLYQDLLISSPAQAQHFLTTVAKPAKLDLVRRTTKTIRFGPQEEQEDDVTGDFAAEVLAVVSVSQLEEVAFRWISLGAAAMWTLSSRLLLCSLIASQEDGALIRALLVSDRSLLSRVVVCDCRPGRPFAPPGSDQA